MPESAGEVTLSANLAYKSSIILGLVPFLAGSNAFDGESRQKPTTVVDANLDWDSIGGSSIDASSLFRESAPTGRPTVRSDGDARARHATRGRERRLPSYLHFGGAPSSRAHRSARCSWRSDMSRASRVACQSRA